MVKILRDEPSDTDRFVTSDKDIGPHDRVAAAIERRILSPEGGGTIGLEGNYGSGKSTIVRLLEKRLADDGKSKEVCFVVFDAWSHEGDPLRRAFLETLIFELAENRDWVLPEEWLPKKKQLAQRKKTTQETKVSSPSAFGVWMALATSLIPIGILIARATSKTTTFQLNSKLDIAWPMVTAIILAAAPLVVIVARVLSLLVATFIRKIVPATPHAGWFQKLTYPIRKSGQNKYRRCFSSKRFNFLTRHGEVTTDSDSFETPEPTSIEFETEFNLLIEDALAGTNRRIVLVVDNLDRLSAEQSLSIWSNLQTFVSKAALNGNDWSSRFSLLVPFTPSAIRKLWKKAGTVTDAVSFFEKTFEIRFNTPPPTLSDWQGYLRDLLKESIPELDESDMHSTLELVELIRRERATRIVPRQLKLFVNQLAVLWETWRLEPSDIPTVHLAYSILNSADRENYEDCLRCRRESVDEELDIASDGMVFPSSQAIQVCGNDLVKNLAAVHFNVAPSKAIQLLLEDQIINLISAGESDKLAELCHQHEESFWMILQAVVRSNVHSQDVEGLTNWSQSLAFLAGGEWPPSADRIKRYFQQRLQKIGVWFPLNETTIDGICQWHLIDPSNTTTLAVADIAGKTLRSKKNDISLEEKLNLASRLASLGIHEKGEKNECWVVQMDASEWLDIASARSIDDNGIPILEPKCSTKSIIAEIVDRATVVVDTQTFELSKQCVEAYRHLKSLRDNVSGGEEIAKTISTTLITASTQNTEESVEQVVSCVSRLHELKLIGETASEQALKTEDVVKAMFAALESALTLEIEDEQSALIASLTCTHPKAEWESNYAAQFPDSTTRLEKIRKSGEIKSTIEIWGYLKAFGAQRIISRLAGAGASGLIADIIEHAASEKSIASVMPNQFMKSNSGWLKNMLESRDTAIEDVVSQLEQGATFVKYLSEEGDVQVLEDRVAIKLFIDLGTEKTISALQTSTCNKIREVTSEAWSKDLQSDSLLSKFTHEHRNSEDEPIVSAAFKNSLVDNLPAILKEDLLIDDSIDILSDLVDELPDDVRRDLGSQTLNSISDTGQGINDAVVKLVGNAILESNASLEINETASIVKNSLHGTGLPSVQWCVEWSRRNTLDHTKLGQEAENLLRAELKAAEAAHDEEEWREQLKMIRDLFQLSEEQLDEDGATVGNESNAE